MSGYGEQDNGQWSSQYPPIVPSSQPTTSQHHHIPSSQTLYTQYSAQGPYPSNSPISQDAYPPITSYSAYPSSTSNNEHSSNVYSHSLTSTSHAHTQLSTSHPPSAARAFEQRSVVFRFSTTNAGIHNSRVYDSYGKSPFDVTSRGQKTTLQSADGRPIAVIYWDYAQPVMVYRGSRFKCMDWFPYNREKRSRTITHGGKRYYTADRDNEVYFMPVDRPGHFIAVWRDPNDVSELEVYQDALEIPGLHEVFLLATLLLAQSHPLGDYDPAERS